MPDVPLPKGITGDEDIPELQELLVNLFNPGDNTLLKTPGIDSLATGSGVCRGQANFQEVHYQVSGQKLVTVSSDGVVVEVADIPGTAECAIAVSFIALVIVVKGGPGYSYSPSGGLVTIGGAYAPSVDVAVINQRFVFVPSDGGPLFYTDVNLPEIIPAANFFDAELLPDINTGTINLKNDLYAGGSDSFEVFRDKGDTDSPFLRVDGAPLETGYISAKARYGGTFVFLGKDRGGSFAFHIMGSGVAPKISNPAIDEILNREYTQIELQQCLPQRFTWKGVDMVAFRLARHSLLFYGTGWSYIQTGIDASNKIQPWDVNYLTFYNGKYITGSATTAAIGTIENLTTEFGARIERQINTFIKSAPDSYFAIDSIFLKCITGTKLIPGTIGLEISKDSLRYGPQVFRSLADIGKTQQQVAWYGGAGVFESFAGVRIRTTADVDFSLDGLTVNGG
jgi:hypothetical protein